MNESIAKLIGVIAVAALVVVGIAASSGSDDEIDFTRNAAFMKMPKAQQARLANSYLEGIDFPDWVIKASVQSGKTTIDAQKEAALRGKASVIEGKGVDGKGGKANIWEAKTEGRHIWSTGVDALSAGKASVKEGRGVDGKGGTANIRAGRGVSGLVGGVASLKGNYEALIEDHIAACVPSGVNSLKNVLVGSYMENTKDLHSWGCAGDVTWAIKESEQLDQKSEQLSSFDQKTNQLRAQGEGMLHDTAMATRVGKAGAELLATCMESKVGDVLLKSHVESSASDCIATVCPALLPDRAKKLGTYWQTRQQLAADFPHGNVEDPNNCVEAVDSSD